jgi:hypothetical protein
MCANAGKKTHSVYNRRAMRRQASAASSPGATVLYVNHTSVIGGAEYALLEHLRIMPPVYGAGPVLCPAGELADALARREIEVPLHDQVDRPGRSRLRQLGPGDPQSCA